MSFKSVWILLPRQQALRATLESSDQSWLHSNPILTHLAFQSPSTETAMLYRTDGRDAPFLLRELILLADQSLTNRQRRSMFNRLSTGFQRIIGLKGKVESLSMILTPTTVEIGVEMTKETFSKSATSGAATVSSVKDDCNCGTINGKPHEPDCRWWFLKDLPRRPWLWSQANANMDVEYKSVDIIDEGGTIVLHVGNGPRALELAKTICHIVNLY